MGTLTSRLLCCPRCARDLELAEDVLECPAGCRYPVRDGVPRLLVATDEEDEERVRRIMQGFYESHPFPGYDDVDSPHRLVQKARRSGFGRWLDDAIDPFATVLEAGCGTGQLGNFLGLTSSRSLVGVDQCLASLGLAEGFRRRFGIDNVQFVQGNLFRLPLHEEVFDVVICSGVLVCTPDPEAGFRELVRRLRPGGKILIGLYNRYARIPQLLRKHLFRLTGGSFRWVDAHLRRSDLGASKKEVWYADQYRNPFEVWHSVDDLLGWFDRAGIRFLSGAPPIGPGLPGESPGIRLFAEHGRGSRPGHLLRQLGWIVSIGREGGLFVLAGEKP